MSREIIEKVKETEQLIDLMKENFIQRKEELRLKEQDRVEVYRQELNHTLVEHVKYQKTKLNEQLLEEHARIDNEMKLK